MPDPRLRSAFSEEWYPTRRAEIDLSPPSGGWSWVKDGTHAGEVQLDDTGTPSYLFAPTLGAGNGIIGLCPIPVPRLPDEPDFTNERRYQVRGATATTATAPASWRFLSLTVELLRADLTDTAALYLQRRPRDGSAGVTTIATIAPAGAGPGWVTGLYNTAFDFDFETNFYFLKAELIRQTTAARISDVKLMIAQMFPR